MINEKRYVNLLKDPNKWEVERERKPKHKPILRNVNFVTEFGGPSFYDLPEFSGVDFSESDMNMASLRNCMFYNCSFDDSKMTFVDMVDAHFVNCTFRRTSMRVSKLGSANFENCLFEESDLSYCSAEETCFRNSEFINTKMEHMSLVCADFSDSKMDCCFVYGISSWDLELENAEQKNLIITPYNMATITVDNIELAQFIYLIINNHHLRNVIDTITSKVVLVLGNFSSSRKSVLEQIRDGLKTKDVIPVIFDFEKPSSRNITETIITLAAMSKYIIVDLSEPRSVPHELANIAIRLPSVRFYPIITEEEEPFCMFDDYKCYPWIRPIKRYSADHVEKVIMEITSEEDAIT